MEEAADAARKHFRLESRIQGIVERNNRDFGAAEELADRARGLGHRTPCWRLAGELKWYYPDLESPEAFDVVDQVLGGDWSPLPHTDVWGNDMVPGEAFIEAWEEVRKPLAPTATPEDALALAEQHPLASTRWSSPQHARYRTAASVAWWLAYLLDNEGRFHLSGRVLGSLLGCSHVQASSYLKRLAREGLLTVREKGRQGHATRYLFRFDAVELARALHLKVRSATIRGITRCRIAIPSWK